jgi:hypothetical protein
MSYSSRVYRQRNPKVQEESKDKPFFPKQKSGQRSRGNSFFQAKPSVNKTGDNLEKAADAIADRVVNHRQSGIQKKEEISIRRQSEEKKEEEKPIQKKMADQEKEKEVNIPKQGDPLKEKETTIQKKVVDDKKEIKKKAGLAEEKDKDKTKEMTA